MGKQHWKTIHKRVMQPQQLVSDDGNSLIVSGKYKKLAAFHLLKADLIQGYGEVSREYALLKSPEQLQVAELRRPNPYEGFDDMSATFIAEVIGDRKEANPWEVWFYMIEGQPNQS